MSSYPHPPEVCVDHYSFWRVHRKDVMHGVKLQDQFHDTAFDVSLNVVEFLGNPARKQRKGREEEDIHHAKVHFVVYTLQDPVGPPVPPVVRVRNQFTGEDGQRWMLGPARYLMIPARKELGDKRPATPPPPRVDHFLCYEAIDVSGVEERVDVTDQFGTTNAEYLRPILFGVPANKNDEGLIHPEVHLAIYEMFPKLTPPAFFAANTCDQLDKRELLTIQSEWLGVPSYKEWPMAE